MNNRIIVTGIETLKLQTLWNYEKQLN